MNIEDIKFKAKRLDNGEWVKGDLVHSTSYVGISYPSDEFSNVPIVHRVDPETVCQFKYMDKENLYSALLLLMNKLEEIKDNPMQDKTFTTALTEVLRYFRDNGELKEAFKLHKSIIQNMEKQPFCKAIMDMFCAKITTEHPELPPFNIKETVEKLSSDEFIETKIKNVLE